MCLRLGTKYHATEPIVQEVVTKSDEIFTICKGRFSNILHNSNLREDVRKNVMESFDESFKEFTNAFDKKKGFLRNTYNRKIYYRNNLNLFLPMEEILLGDFGEDSGDRYSYIPILYTIAEMLMNEKIRRHCENVTLPENGRMMFDITDGGIIKENEFIRNNRNCVLVLFFKMLSNYAILSERLKKILSSWHLHGFSKSASTLENKNRKY